MPREETWWATTTDYQTLWTTLSALCIQVQRAFQAQFIVRYLGLDYYINKFNINMYLRYYLNEKNERVYTFAVSLALRPHSPLIFLLSRFLTVWYSFTTQAKTQQSVLTQVRNHIVILSSISQVFPWWPILRAKNEVQGEIQPSHHKEATHQALSRTMSRSPSGKGLNAYLLLIN